MYVIGAMDMRGDDDASDTSSIHSASQSTRSKGKVSSSGRPQPANTTKSSDSKPKASSASDHTRPVSKLRPKAPVKLSDDATILEAAQAMAANRADAALLMSARGSLMGILTDNDITKRVVSKMVDPVETGVSAVMTKSPKCVSMEDSALDALEMMVDNKFRHLPVLDRDGSVVGLLDIAKCLYDAISIMEKVQQKQDQKQEGDKASNAVLTAAMKKAMTGKGGSNRAQLAAMQLLMDQMFGDKVPTLGTIIGADPLISVGPKDTVREASMVMADIRKGVLVMDGDELVGILTPKDLLNRVIAKELSPDDVSVEDVMTPNPACVSPEMTLLDAMREMHDQKFLHLPVRDEENRMVGIVNVMELLCRSAEGSNGGSGWREFFGGIVLVTLLFECMP